MEVFSNKSYVVRRQTIVRHLKTFLKQFQVKKKNALDRT